MADESLVAGSKMAVIVVSIAEVTVILLFVVFSPAHPTNWNPGSGMACKCTGI